MIRRLRERAAFQQLSREGTRWRTADLWCTWCPVPEMTSMNVAFAIGRASGPAVTRNRRRRQIRAILHEIDRVTPLPPGLLLIGARRPLHKLTFGQLTSQITSMVSWCSAGSSA